MVVVVGPVLVVGWVLVVVASVVVVGMVVVVGTVVVVGAVVVVGTVVVDGAVTGGWVVAPKVENASVVVVLEVAGACAVTAPAALAALLGSRGTASGVGTERVGTVVGARGPVVGVDAGLGGG